MSQQAQILTYGFDSADYDQIVDEMAADIATNPRVAEFKGKVMTLGPVDDLGTPYHFDQRSFQESLRTRLFRAGLFDFTMAVDAIDSKSVQDARKNVRYFEWLKESSSDEELLSEIRDLYAVDYILFGRLSSQVAHSGKNKEVSHRMNWSIGDCKKGTIVWSKEVTFSKKGEYAPEKQPDWAKYPRQDNPSSLYQVGYVKASQKLSEGRIQALENAKMDLITRIDPILFKRPELLDGLSIIPGRQHPIEWTPGDDIWVLAQLPRSDLDVIEQMLTLGSEMDSNWDRLTSGSTNLSIDDQWGIVNTLIDNFPDCLMKQAGLSELRLKAAEIALSLGKLGTTYELLSQLEVHGSTDPSIMAKVAALKKQVPEPTRLWVLRKAYPNHVVDIQASYAVTPNNRVEFTELNSVLREAFLRAEFPVQQNREGLANLAFNEVVANLLDPQAEPKKKLYVLLFYSKGSGVTETINVGGFEIVRPTTDSQVEFALVDTERKEVVAKGKFQAEVGERSEILAKSLSKHWIDSRLLPSFEIDLEARSKNPIIPIK